MTRGRHHNIAHLVADNLDDARSQWIDVFSRDRADLGPAHARTRARRHRPLRTHRRTTGLGGRHRGRGRYPPGPKHRPEPRPAPAREPAIGL